jgi:ABC-type sugar transport system ATPase subunit
MASLTLEHIDKHFGSEKALSDVSLDVKDGTFCVLLGPSGCGKSTLLQIVAGLIRQDHGSVLLDGHVVNELEPRERDVAMVFQSYALYPHMTVAQNLSFGLQMRGMSKAEAMQKVQETARLLEIDDLLRRKPRQLSGGQRQRVAMGRALVRRPRVFLLDEPLSNLDAQLRINVRLELKKLHKKIKTTILYVTHDQVEAMTLGDLVVVLRKGKVHQIGTPETIYNFPSDTFVATFVGSPMMNLFEGIIRYEDIGAAFYSSGFTFDLGAFSKALDGRSVEVGVRPEDVQCVKNGTRGISARVEMVSNVGAEKYVHARLGDCIITVRTSKDEVFSSGQEVCLIINTERLHIFEKGRRIARTGA